MTHSEIDWLDIAALQRGTGRQRAASRALQSLQIFEVLRDYTPVLVGTIPLDVDVEASDLDIICEVRDLEAFEHLVTSAFGRRSGFRIARKPINQLPSIVAPFNYGGFTVEIFGQPRPVVAQNAYRHMIVEACLLAIGGEEARQEIRRLKASGLKTEPAFARYFDLKGDDPYEVLLQLAVSSQ